MATEADSIVGYAVTYVVPFTFDLRPTLVLKELFVAEPARGQGVGRALLEAVMQRGHLLGARLLRWQVLPGNAAAKRLYRCFGGRRDAEWENWLLELSPQRSPSLP